MSEPDAVRDERIATLLDVARAEEQANGKLDLDSWRQRHPELIGELLPLLETMQNLDTAVSDWKGVDTMAEVKGGATLGANTAAEAAEEDGPLPQHIGRYRILERVGSGGMGAVYKAHDPQLDRTVAVKLPHFRGKRNASSAQQRFLREARAAARVRHPHVCPIYDVGEQDGLPYVVMAYIDGQTLAEQLRTQGPYESRRAVAIIRQVAEALEAVHAHGIIHRDLKPGNILLASRDRAEAVLTDFGLARPEQDTEHLTAEGVLVGTPSYMPVEQISPGNGTLGPWTDIYSLGVVLYQMLTGQLPYQASTPLDLLLKIGSQELQPPSRSCEKLDPALEAIVLKAMARRQEDRYQNARELIDALDGWLVGQAFHAAEQKTPTVATEPVVTASSPAKPVRSSRRWPLVAAAVLLLLAPFAYFYGATIIRFATNQGELVIEVGDEDIEVRIVQNGAVVKDKSTMREFTIQAGKGEVEIFEKDGVGPLVTKKFTLNRGGRTTLSVTAEVAAARRPPIDTESNFALRFEWGDKVAFAGFTVLDPSRPFTLEGFVTPASDEGADIFGTDGIRLQIAQKKWLYNYWDEKKNNWFSATTVVPGKRTHVALVFNVRNQRVFVDGVLAKETTLDKALRPGSAPFFIGAGSGVFKGMTGLLDEVRISKVARYEKNFTPAKRFEPDADTIALYHCDEGEGDKLIDSSGNEHHGKILGARWVKADGTEIDGLPARFTNSLGMDFALVPKGKAWLGGGGSKPGDKEVEFKDDFYMGVYEVTQEEWEKVTGDNPSGFQRNGGREGYVKDVPDADLKRFPVDNVSWDMAQSFADRLNAQLKETGWLYRLPTEVEWEYACRGGPMTDKLDSAFHIYLEKPSNQLLPRQANFGGSGLKRPCKVGSYAPNRLGLCDMHGNVWEWCADEYPHDPSYPKETPLRQHRGGAWDQPEFHCFAWAAATFEPIPSWNRNIAFGLRLVRVRVGASSPSPEPVSITAEQRKALEWVLSVGGQLNLSVDAKGVVLKRGDLLPAGNFELHTLSLKGVKNVQGVVEKLRNVPPVKGNISFRDAPVGDADIEALAALPAFRGIAYWDLGGTRVTDTALKVVGQVPALHGGNFDRIAITDVGVKYLAASNNLMHLNLNDTAVTDAALEYLAAPKWWADLQLKGTKVTEAGVKKLARAVPHLRIIWDGGVIESTVIADPDRPAAIDLTADQRQALEWVLSVGGELNLSVEGEPALLLKRGDSLPAEGFRVMGLALKGVKDVASSVEKFSAIPPVRSVIVLTDTNIGDRELQALTALPAFQRTAFWYLAKTRVTDAALERLGQLNLWGGSLDQTAITDTGLKYLSTSTGLQNISLMDTAVTDAGLELLAIATHWRDPVAGASSINVMRTKVTEAGVKQLARAVPHLRIHWDGGVIQPTIPGDRERRAAMALHPYATLRLALKTGRVVDVDSSDPLPDEAFVLTDIVVNFPGELPDRWTKEVLVPSIIELSSLQRIFARYRNDIHCTDEDLLQLAKMSSPKTLATLCIRPLHLTTTAIDVLKQFPALKDLVFTAPEPDDKLLARLAELSAVEFLHIEHLDGKGKVSAKGKAALTALPLSRLTVNGTTIDADFARQLARMPTLRVLNAGSNQYQSGAVAELAKSKSLTELQIGYSGSSISDADLEPLPGMNTLQGLNVMATRVTDAGLKYLVNCPSLKFVTLSHCKVTQAGVEQLAKKRPDMRIIWDSGVIEPKVVADPDRRAAEWVLSVGGTVRINVAGQLQDLSLVDEMPVAEFQLVEVMLHGNKNVTDAGLHNLDQCTNLTSLNLNFTPLTDASLAYFNDFRKLKYLGLEGTAVTDSGLANFKDCDALESISLGNTSITDAGLALLKNAKRLTALGLNGLRITDAGLAVFKDRKGLTHLNLSWSTISDKGLANFKECRALTNLSLTNTRITDEGLANFKDCRSITMLSLGETKIGDAGLAQFRECRNLQGLVLRGTNITDAGLGIIERFSKLAALEIQGAPKVTAAGIENLKRVLPKCRITWDGGVIEPIVLADPDRRAAEWVLSVGGRVQANGRDRWIAMPDDLPAGPFRLTHADLTACKEVTDAGLACFEGCKNLTFIVLSFTQVGDAGLGYFKDCKNLVHLRLDRTQVSDAGLVHFKDCRDLTYLWLDRTQVSGAGLVHFKDCKNLSLLGLEGTPVSDAGLVHFKDCKQLQALQLGDTGLSDAGVIHFKNCKNLTGINLNRTRVGDAGLAHFQDCRNLTHLSLQGTSVGDTGLAHFKNCYGLTTLWLNRTQVSDAGLSHFKDCKNLLHLSLEATPVSDTGLANLKDCTKLLSLDLTATQVSDAGLAYFKNCKNLIDLSLERTPVSDAGLAHFKDCKNLKSLRLGGTGLSDAGLDVIRDMPSVSWLTIQGAKVTREGIKKLAAARPDLRIDWSGGLIEPTAAIDPDRRAAEWVLSVGGIAKVKIAGREQDVEDKRLPSEAFQLSFVHLMRNRQVDDEGLANLRGCRHIRWLDVRDTLVTDAGLAHLKDCTSFETLWLSSNRVTDAGLVHFKDCRRLAYLSLESTQITDAGLAVLDRRYLVSIGLGGTKITDAGLAHFKDCKLLDNINLYETDVTDKGLAHFKDCKNLKILTLALTPITDAGLVHFKDCTGITRLDVRETRITDAGLATTHGFRRLTYLDLRGSKGVTAAGVDAVHKALPECRILWDGGEIAPTKASADPDRRAAEWVLSVGGTVTISGAGPDQAVKASKDLPKTAFRLTEVYLTRDQLAGDDEFACFRGCIYLKKIGLRGTLIGDAGLAYFKDSKNLQYLTLTSFQVSDAGMVHFKDCKNLSWLGLR